MSNALRVKRLERIGEPTDVPGVPFQHLSVEDQRNWLDLAEVVLALAHDDGSKRLRDLADDWDRYGYMLANPADRDSMRRAVVVELRVLVEQLWAQCQ